MSDFPHKPSATPNRYHRQALLANIGKQGQHRLAHSHVLIVGCGALGAPAAEWLARAGVGTITIADRDIVEPTNLQRQTLYTERDAADANPKAVAAAQRLATINSEIIIRPAVIDVTPTNLDHLLEPSADANQPTPQPVQLIIDGTDNVATRYLLNDAAVERQIPLIYGGAIANEGRQATFITTPGPNRTACLRCAFGNPPPPASLPTCDTVGVLGPVAGIVAAHQAIDAIKVLTGNLDALSGSVLAFDAWANQTSRINIKHQQDPDCPCCAHRRFQYLRQENSGSNTTHTATICGRNAVQITPPKPNPTTHAPSTINLQTLASRWHNIGQTIQTPYLARLTIQSHTNIEITVFTDGRAIIAGTADPAHARSLYDRYIGN